uniref:Uncharacterized protein n=1 Tax=Oryza punctata TaxID=4537 RepID=A0A0E0LD88_ORYPU
MWSPHVSHPILSSLFFPSLEGEGGGRWETGGRSDRRAYLGLGSGSTPGTRVTRPLDATGFGALPTSSTMEDTPPLLAEEERHYIDDHHHLVPSSGQEEGSGGRDVVVPGDHDGEEDYPDDIVPDLDLDILINGVVDLVPGGHLNADVVAFVPTIGGCKYFYSTSVAAYRHYITSSALATASHGDRGGGEGSLGGGRIQLPVLVSSGSAWIRCPHPQ